MFSLKIYLFPVLKVIASSIILQNIINHPSGWFHISSFSINVATFIFHFSYSIYFSSFSNLETFIFLFYIPYFKLFKCCNNLHVEDDQLRPLLIAPMAAVYGLQLQWETILTKIYVYQYRSDWFESNFCTWKMLLYREVPWRKKWLINEYKYILNHLSKIHSLSCLCKWQNQKHTFIFQQTCAQISHLHFQQDFFETLYFRRCVYSLSNLFKAESLRFSTP